MNQNQFDYDKLESRGIGNGKAELYYGGNPMTTSSSLFNKRQELFVSSMGETGINELKFFNIGSDGNKELQRVELTIDGCNHLTVHSKNHLTVLMASNNGSVFAWMSRPAKHVQPLAPDFNELERNIWYVEREDEFEDQDNLGQMKIDSNPKQSKKKDRDILPLNERQQKLASRDIDLTRKSTTPMIAK